ncbi:hypothetical protein [Enterococcus sp. AZ126]|uniref:hypothetical protein n=1 Tax=Enterococcus sp. AZ126 TaxID=2774635 RepID=UPI003F29D934
MSVAEQNTQKQGKKIIKKYILHQKVNPRLLGVELFNNRLFTPQEAYLSCKLIFKKDVHSLRELELVAEKIYEMWTEENDGLPIKRINVYMSTAYIILTFTIGFYEEVQIKQLWRLKECAKEFIETYDDVIKREKEAEHKKKAEEIHAVLEKFDQLAKKMDGLENRLMKNESIVVDSGELLKNELIKVSQTIKEQMNQTENNIKESQNDSENEEQAMKVAKTKRERKYSMDRSKQFPVNLKIKTWRSDRLQKKMVKGKSDPIKAKTLKEPISQLEMDILMYFTENKQLPKKRMIQKKQFLTLKAKVEFIDYLWMLLELEGNDELIIADELSCRELIKELGQFMKRVEKVAVGPTIFNYWIYCPQEILVKLEGYIALKDFLSRSLKLSNNTLI